MTGPRTQLPILIAAAAFASPVLAADTLPYFTRTHSYSTTDTTVQGDPRTVGMAGATIGIADTAINAKDNPAGLAMTVNLGDLNFATNQLRDSALQNFNQPVSVNSFGAAVAPYPWGFGVSVVTPYREGQPYLLPSNGNSLETLSIAATELRLNAARVLLNNRLSVGASLRFGGADETIMQSFAQNFTQTSSSTAIGFTIGAMLKLDDRVLLGASYVTPMTYPFGGIQPADFPGFYENINSPARWNVGVGWIPNRYFRAGASLTLLGTTPGAALLRDDSVSVGSAVTFQPRVGASYVFADYENFSGSIFAGTYLEASRIDSSPTRLHGTTGFELKPWILVVGAAVDASGGYQNVLFGVGIDVLKTMEKLELVPKLPTPPHHGLVSDPFVRSDEGLPRPLMDHWDPYGPHLDPVKIMLDIPNKIGDKIDSISKPALEDLPPPPSAPKYRKAKPLKKKKRKKPLTPDQE